LDCRHVCKTCAFHDALQAGKQKEVHPQYSPDLAPAGARSREYGGHCFQWHSQNYSKLGGGGGGFIRSVWWGSIVKLIRLSGDNRCVGEDDIKMDLKFVGGREQTGLNWTWIQTVCVVWCTWQWIFRAHYVPNLSNNCQLVRTNFSPCSVISSECSCLCQSRLRDLRLPPRSRRELRCSRLLRS
jgi:hypothetical protein